jgi:phosphoglycerate dehydrogenase-like enzyme
MSGMLLSKAFVAQFGERLNASAKEAGASARVVHMPDDAQARLDEDALAQIEVAYLTRDIRFSDHYATFGETVTAAPNLKWVHFSSTGIDQHPWLKGLIARGVKLTSSAGSNGEPVGQTAIGGMLMLARRVPRWIESQRRHAWEPMRGKDAPRDLEGQTVVIVGLGTIGATVARFCQAVGMKVLGVRRSPIQPGDPVDEMHRIGDFATLMPRADWVVLACPLTDDTRHLLNAQTLAALPVGAHIVNVARGGCIDEHALIEALKSGRLGGAHLDVFEKEPLAADSKLWDMPNVICTPHNAQASSGNDGRAFEIFSTNFARLIRNEPMVNERQA